MKRREFIKNTSLMGALLLVKPSLAFNQDNNITVDELIGKGNPALYGTDFKLREEARLQFNLMKKSAKESGFNIHVISSYRSYAHQNRIWERKYLKYTKQGLSPEKSIQKIIEYSTIPGTSRHHWGTDLDIIDSTKGIPSNPLNEVHFNKGGRMHNFKLWLDENTEKFGFYIVYTNKEGRKGFAYEPWHFSYKPLASEYLKAYRKLDIKQILQSNKLLGSNHFTEEFIQQYINQNVLDINPDLL